MFVLMRELDIEKRFIIRMLFCLSVLLTAGCASRHATYVENLSTSTVRQMGDSLLAGTFVMDVDYMYPQRVSSQGLTAGYAVQICGTHIRSILPYRGRAFRSSMEMGKQGPLHFDSRVSAYTVRQDRKARWLVDFDTVNGQECLHYSFSFSSIGRGRLKVSFSDRDWIVFEGWLRDE